MIKIIRKEQCCGCSACLHICPKHSISFREDKEGFLYPQVDKDTCIDCGLCVKVCPVLNQDEERMPLQVFAAKHTDDEIRMKSSSGGIFTLLAEQIIDKGGVVFGARFNENWEVVHDYTDTREGLTVFRGSKYLQSKVGNTYEQVKAFLISGREVMYTGTPCQISALKSYLKTEYQNLLAVDFICHGVPSPKTWKLYLAECVASKNKNGQKNVLSDINFRDKSTGWRNYSLSLHFVEDSVLKGKGYIVSSSHLVNPYMMAFLSNLSLRPSCYCCPSKSGKSGSDITIGDFWGLEHIMPGCDDNGLSVVLIHNVNKLPCFLSPMISMGYDIVEKYNPCLTSSVEEPMYRGLFFNLLDYLGFHNALRVVTSSQWYFRIVRKIYRTYYRFQIKFR